MSVLVDAVTPALHSNGLSVSQMPYRHDEKQIGIETILMHSSGEFIANKFYGSPDNQTPQKIGSLITYYRRYSLMAITGVAPSDDDDGNQAQSHAIKQPVKPKMANKTQVDRLLFLIQETGAKPSDATVAWAEAMTDAKIKVQIDATEKQIQDLENT